MSDHITDRVAQLDQVTKDLTEWAKVFGTFFDALIDAGFERPEAVDIIMGWQSGQAAAMVASSRVVMSCEFPTTGPYI